MKISSANMKSIDRENFGQIIELDKNQNRWAWTPKDWVATADKEKHFLVFAREQEVVGFALWNISQEERRAHLLKVLVHLQHRQKKLASQIIQESLHEFKKLKVNSLILEVDVDNAPAISLYEKFGFKTIHRSKGFYSNGSDAFIMESKLILL